MADYKISEANQITQMLKDLSTLKEAHPSIANYIDPAITDLSELRVFILAMLEDTPND